MGDAVAEEENAARRRAAGDARGFWPNGSPGCARLDMAVVVSQGQNEIAELKAKGLDILPHRKRMEEEDLEANFKDPNDPLRLVFVCAMWITGFDVPTCSTIYLDKPMKNHTLMQTIARANRRAPGKKAGVIVDYVGVFQNLQKALAIYAATAGRRYTDPEQGRAGRGTGGGAGRGADILHGQWRGPRRHARRRKLARLKLIGNAVEALIAPDDVAASISARPTRHSPRLQGAAARRACCALSQAGRGPSRCCRGHPRQARAGGHFGHLRTDRGAA